MQVPPLKAVEHRADTMVNGRGDVLHVGLHSHHLYARRLALTVKSKTLDSLIELVSRGTEYLSSSFSKTRTQRKHTTIYQAIYEIVEIDYLAALMREMGLELKGRMMHGAVMVCLGVVGDDPYPFEKEAQAAVPNSVRGPGHSLCARANLVNWVTVNIKHSNDWPVRPSRPESNVHWQYAHVATQLKLKELA